MCLSVTGHALALVALAVVLRGAADRLRVEAHAEIPDSDSDCRHVTGFDLWPGRWALTGDVPGGVQGLSLSEDGEVVTGAGPGGGVTLVGAARGLRLQGTWVTTNGVGAFRFTMDRTTYRTFKGHILLGKERHVVAGRNDGPRARATCVRIRASEPSIQVPPGEPFTFRFVIRGIGPSAVTSARRFFVAVSNLPRGLEAYDIKVVGGPGVTCERLAWGPVCTVSVIGPGSTAYLDVSGVMGEDAPRKSIYLYADLLSEPQPRPRLYALRRGVFVTAAE